jgi:hypothetical protein
VIASSTLKFVRNFAFRKIRRQVSGL